MGKKSDILSIKPKSLQRRKIRAYEKVQKKIENKIHKNHHEVLNCESENLKQSKNNIQNFHEDEKVLQKGSTS